MAKRKTLPRKFERHQCSNKCLLVPSHSLRGYSPLSKPLLSGWERLLFRQRIKRTVAYRAPCGRLLRNMKEIHRYLKETNNSLAVDNFDFSPEINCLAEYIIESAIVQKSDISGGQEPMPIPLINYYDNTLPQKCVYSNKVIPTEGVHINKEVDFLVGCDCEDDCMVSKRVRETGREKRCYCFSPHNYLHPLFPSRCYCFYAIRLSYVLFSPSQCYCFYDIRLFTSSFFHLFLSFRIKRNVRVGS